MSSQLLQVYVRPERETDLRASEYLVADSYTHCRTYIDSIGNRCTRLIAPAGVLKLSNLFQARDTAVQETMPCGGRQVLVNGLPDAVLIYLLGCRYCDTDGLATKAWELFGKNEPGWPRVHAKRDCLRCLWRDFHGLD